MNKRYTHIYNICIGILALYCLVACKRRPLEDDGIPIQAKVYVEVDWLQSGMEPGEASVLFYPHDKNEKMHILYIQGNRGSISLKQGKYSIVVFNNKLEDFDTIGFRGTDKYETIQAFAKPRQPIDYIPSPNEAVVDNPDMLASDSQNEFEVTPEMIRRTQEEVKNKVLTRADIVDVSLNMKLITVITKVIVHVKNLYLILKGTQNGIIKGFSESVLLSTRQPTHTPVTQFFDLPEAEYYDGSYKDGVLRGELTVFGECKAAARSLRQSVHFVLRAVLRDNKQTKFEKQIKVTDQIEYKGNQILLNIGADSEQKNPPIVIPLVDIGDPNSGFNPNVDGWEDEDDIVKPL